MNQIFLGEPVQEIKNWFVETFPSWPAYTTLEFYNGTIQTKEISGAATRQNIGSDQNSYANGLKSCQLGNKVTEISNEAFSYCGGLTSISIPNSVTSIGSGAFSYCSLDSISIPNSVTSIGSYAFNCCGLTSISIPNSVTSIGNGAFSECGGLTSISIPNSVTLIGWGAFEYSYSLISILFEGKAMSDITAMANYPWGIEDTSIIKAGIS